MGPWPGPDSVGTVFFLADPSPETQVERVRTFSTRVVEFTDGQMATLRLFGVDAPETSQPYGIRATRRARQYVGGKRVQVTIDEIGRYGRAIASVEVQGGSPGQMLIRDGLAWHYDNYAPNTTKLARLERQAHNANRGL